MTRWISCPTDYCGGAPEFNCILCGGLISERCPCGDSGDLDACICGLREDDWRYIKPRHIGGLLVGLVKTVYATIRYWDWYWFKSAFGIQDW